MNIKIDGYLHVHHVKPAILTGVATGPIQIWETGTTIQLSLMECGISGNFWFLR
jgi:hypothetical protein